MVAMAMFVLFSGSVVYVLYRLVRKLFDVFRSFNSKLNRMAHSAEVALEAFKYNSEDPDRQ